MAPGAHQERPDHHQRDIGEDRHREGEGHVVADAELAADLDLAQGPGDERPDGAEGDDLPEATLLEGGERQPVFEVGRRDVDLPDVPGRPEGRAVNDQRGAEHREEQGRDAEEPDIERPDPEIEQVSAEQRAAADAVFSFETQHRHREYLPASQVTILDGWAHPSGCASSPSPLWGEVRSGGGAACLRTLRVAQPPPPPTPPRTHHGLARYGHLTCGSRASPRPGGGGG